MQPRSIIAVLVTLIVILAAALFVVTWGGDDGDDTATPSTTTSLATTTTAAPTTTSTTTTTTTIPVACSIEADDTATTTTTTEAPATTTTTTTAAAGDADDANAATDDEASTTTEAPTPNLGPNDSVSTVGLGEVDFGMTVRQAEAAAGTTMIPCGPVGECYRVTPEVAPAGISFLVTEGTIERVDIASGVVTTRSGIGIGTDEERIIELFGDQIETAINDDSSVDLIFVPTTGADVDFRVIFTIRDGVVETFRSGRVPQVTVQDPCADAA